MSVGSDAADQVVRESIQITESAVKLAGLGAKNLAAMLIALCKEMHKTKGKTNLSAMLAEGRPLKVVRLKKDDLKTFGGECRQYGALYTAIQDKKATDGMVDVLVRADDVAKINRIMERMGYVAPEQDSKRKNGGSREASVRSSSELSASRSQAISATPDAQQPIADKLAGLRGAAKRTKSKTAQER